MASIQIYRMLIGALVVTTIGAIVGFSLYYSKMQSDSTVNANAGVTSNLNATANSNTDYSGDKASFDSGYASGTVDGASKSSKVGQRFNPTGTGRVILQYEDGYMQGYVYGCGQSGKDCSEIMTWFSKAMEVQGTRYTN